MEESEELPWSSLPDWAKDGVYTDTNIHLSFLDRIRVLFHGNVNVYMRTVTQHHVGNTQTDKTRITILPIFRNPWRKRPEMGTVEVKS